MRLGMIDKSAALSKTWWKREPFTLPAKKYFLPFLFSPPRNLREAAEQTGDGETEGESSSSEAENHSSSSSRAFAFSVDDEEEGK